MVVGWTPLHGFSSWRTCIVAIIRAVFKRLSKNQNQSNYSNQSQLLVITCNSREAWEKSRIHGAIGFASHWLKNWRNSFKPITKRSNRNHVITFDSHLRTTLKKLYLPDSSSAQCSPFLSAQFFKLVSSICRHDSLLCLQSALYGIEICVILIHFR